jgi:hypothetical protein
MAGRSRTPPSGNSTVLALTRSTHNAKRPILLYNARIVIPASFRQATLEALHSGYLGVEKCRSKSRTAVWWPKIGADIAHYVALCWTCVHWAKDRAEPLQSSPLPELPWQKVATDLFELDGKHYVVVVEYYSLYVDLVQLRRQTADDVINALKAIFGEMVCLWYVFRITDCATARLRFRASRLRTASFARRQAIGLRNPTARPRGHYRE